MLNMIKHKNSLNVHEKITTIFGYGLFALTVILFLITQVIPFGLSFQYPDVLYTRITMMVLMFALSAILPALVSYFIGDKATHAKNKSLHRYNGVLFGVAAYWAAMLFNWIGFSTVWVASSTPLVVDIIISVILTITLMAVVAIAYTKNQKHKASVLQYRPFQIVLITSVVGGFLFPAVTGDLKAILEGVSSVTLVPLVATGVAYAILGKYQATRLARLSDAIVAMTMGWVAIWLADSLIGYLQLPYQIASIAYVVGLVVFVIYLYLRTRKA
jgi:hypothetical protein